MKQEEQKKNGEVTLEEYELMLFNHDWYYMMSDDNSKYLAGANSLGRLSEISKQSHKHLELYNNYITKHRII